ncbi:hypothetical protein [Lactobacillus acetotolerans]|uniref:hypothetical protein n=1 Tax=Lactobacillus acetotolerans TaxID=1600 RepID=UPI002FDA3A83
MTDAIWVALISSLGGIIIALINNHHERDEPDEIRELERKIEEIKRKDDLN